MKISKAEAAALVLGGLASNPEIVNAVAVRRRDADFVNDLALFAEALAESLVLQLMDGPRPTAVHPDRVVTLAQARKEAEDAAVRAALRLTGGNRTKAAAVLGVTTRSLYHKLRGTDVIP